MGDSSKSYGMLHAMYCAMSIIPFIVLLYIGEFVVYIFLTTFNGPFKICMYQWMRSMLKKLVRVFSQNMLASHLFPCVLLLLLHEAA